MGAVNFVKDLINLLTDPRILLPAAAILFFVAVNRKGFWSKRTALVLFPLAAVFVALSMLDPDFAPGVAFRICGFRWSEVSREAASPVLRTRAWRFATTGTCSHGRRRWRWWSPCTVAVPRCRWKSDTD